MNSCFNGKFKVTSGYRLPDRPAHNGIDLVGVSDKTVYAPCDGIIRASTIVDRETDTGNTWEWGNYVRLDTSDGKYSIFLCHLASRSVVKGQKVKKGDKLGIMGNTGKSSGAHVHFEVRKKGTSTKVDPASFIGIPNKKGTYENKPKLETGNDIVWQLMNGSPKIEINEPQRAIAALDKAKNHPEFMSLYWIIYKVVNGNG